MIKIGILGGSGYTALELIKLLLRHPQVEICCLTTRGKDQPHVSKVHPQLLGQLDLPLLPLSAVEVAKRCDCVFSCLPHAASASAIHEIIDGSTRVIDFSADYRLWDVAKYEKWYQTTHPDADRLGNVPYGLPEFFRDEIRDSQLVANPGCYPTGSILALAPLIIRELVDPLSIIIDSKSGVSGAGRTPKLGTHFPECNETIKTYSVGEHRHIPEINQILGSVSSTGAVNATFTPHLVPMNRGILTTAYAKISDGKLSSTSTKSVVKVLSDAYQNEPFVMVNSNLPSTKDVVHTNYCHVGAKVVGDWIVVVSAIDNLIKGAAGAAVQNMNLLFGFDETVALA